MKVLVFSNLDCRRPFGQFTRPYYLGSVLHAAGWDVHTLGQNVDSVPYGTASAFSARSAPVDLRRTLREFAPDVVYAHQNLPATFAVLGAGRPVVADFHSLPSREWFGFAKAETGRARNAFLAAGARARLTEALILRRASSVVAAGPELRAELDRMTPRGPVDMVPNGLPDSFLDLEPGAPTEEAPFVTSLPPDSTPANRYARDFVTEVANELLTQGSSRRIHVTGSQTGPSHPLVDWVGVVRDLPTRLAGAGAVLLPYPERARLCGGARNKWLEALACGRPVVTTMEGTRGFREGAEWPGVWMTRDDPTQFAHAARAAAQSTQIAVRLTESARRKLAWSSSEPRLSQVLRDATQPMTGEAAV